MDLDEAELALLQAQKILAHPRSYRTEEWMLVATLVGEADLAIRDNSSAVPPLRALLTDVVEHLKEVTGNFADPAFLNASRAARRRNKALFSTSK